MAEPSPKPSRGEKTRQQILDAALKILASEGYRALTHRAIAKQAGVSLSLTSYHFKDLETLLHDAFAQYKQTMLEQIESHWQSLHQELLQPALAAAQAQDDHSVFIELLADKMTDFIEADLRLRGEGVAIEMTFHFDLHLHEQQRNFAYELCNRLHPWLQGFYQQMGSADPATDAHLLLDTAHFLRFRRLTVPQMLTREDVYRRLHRLLGVQLACKC